MGQTTFGLSAENNEYIYIYIDLFMRFVRLPSCLAVPRTAPRLILEILRPPLPANVACPTSLPARAARL